ncbi:hypothetical protein PanWU01x14_298730 [Parasponia andersonii]|uniref:Uncharacterized protein n=1 Tax=Parasponia andersonii TaxID=3476 RepID=A0A2P5AUQ5_PARAD|nr:hypothetical protein PanWU01x14_298730 [Parasponia andersonii]
MHSDGYLEIKDRSKDIIISVGENVSSVDVESASLQPPVGGRGGSGDSAGRFLGRDAVRIRGVKEWDAALSEILNQSFTENSLNVAVVASQELKFQGLTILVRRIQWSIACLWTMANQLLQRDVSK